ncbi:hypothetical protein FOA43_001506 [Brettanomyces nanus]|uniref:Protein FAF1 n=1 Tax=Eeniella nana TaxID=13502 RepID=A0A875S266_EENNA|nr:uncharacterized protein FOA43_001506 [Brettanomyces nanus]QPG74182.1 hypothetical protein FOA43_001506 [Brettanomyces nanus]
MAPLIVRFEDKYDPKMVENSRSEKKILRSGKPISLAQLKRKGQLAEKQKLKQAKTEEDKQDMKNDLELQRLLDESHILAGDHGFSGADVGFSGADVGFQDEVMGNSRVRTLDSRMQKLAEANQAHKHKLENMPMNYRKGMVKAQLKRISKYEEEAHEAGIILAKSRKGEFRRIGDDGTTSFTERIGSGMKKQSRMRDRGLRVNTVGKATSHGVLLSKHDLHKITGGDKKKRKGRK